MMVRLALVLALLGCATAHPKPISAEIVQKQADAYNAQNADEFAATYAEDAVITTGVGPEKRVFLQGRAAIREWYGNMFAKYPNCRSRIAERKAQGNEVWDYEVITGRGPERPDPWDAGWVRYVVEDGLIKTVDLF